MSEAYQCVIGGLTRRMTAKILESIFESFGHVTDAKVIKDKESGRFRVFGFITYNKKEAVEYAIESLHGQELDGRPITVAEAQPGMGTDCGGDGDFGRDRGRDYGGMRGSNSVESFKCGKHGHFARECPSDDVGRGDKYDTRDGRYGSREDRYGGRGGGDGGSYYVRVRNGDRDCCGGGSSGHQYDPDRNGVRYYGDHELDKCSIMAVKAQHGADRDCGRDGDRYGGHVGSSSGLYGPVSSGGRYVGGGYNRDGSYRYNRDYSGSRYGPVPRGGRYVGGGYNRDGSYRYNRDYSGSPYGPVPRGGRYVGGGYNRDGSYRYNRDNSGSHYGPVPRGDRYVGGGYNSDEDNSCCSGFDRYSRDHSGSYEPSSGGSY